MGWTNSVQIGHSVRMIFALLTMLMLYPDGAAFATSVNKVSVEGETISIQLDGAIDKVSVRTIHSPHRIAVDIGGADKGARGMVPGGVVAGIRQGKFDANTTRLVFDLRAPVMVTQGTFSDNGRQLRLHIRPVNGANFDTASRKPPQVYLPPVANRASPPRSRYNVVIPLTPTRGDLPRPKIYGPAGRPLVVIDAGHGGHDPGAISPVTGAREKDITLAIARKVRDQLLASGRVRVAMIREDDRFYAHFERANIARGIGADLFISIHADSAGGVDAAGATVYTLSEVASDRKAAELAERENKSDIINGVNLNGENREVASILVDLAQRETMNASVGFANLLRRESTGLIPFRSGYHRMAGFAVLKAPDTPAILLEVGYLTNASDVNRLSSADGQQKIAQGIRKAVEIFFAKRLAQR